MNDEARSAATGDRGPSAATAHELRVQTVRAVLDLMSLRQPPDGRVARGGDSSVQQRRQRVVDRAGELLRRATDEHCAAERRGDRGEEARREAYAQAISSEVLPWTDLTLDDARDKLSGWQFANEALPDGGREIRSVAEALLREVDRLRARQRPGRIIHGDSDP